MGTFLFKKNVDQSLLKAGVTIPADLHQKLMSAIGVKLSKGEKVDIKIVIDGIFYDAILTYVNLSEKYANREIVQIRYAEKSAICMALKNIFHQTDSVIYEQMKNESVEKNKISIPDENTEEIAVYAKGPMQLEIKCFPKEPQIMNQIVEGPLKKAIDKFLNGYVDAKKETFAGHPFGTFVRNEIPNVLYNTQLVNPDQYLITGSVGQGNWAMIPWICIFDRSITTTATKGVYIVYLLSKDGKSLYLSFNQGCTDIRNNHSKKETIQIMRENANQIRERIDSRGFSSDSISLGDSLTELGELYQEGMIFYKEYKRGTVPSEEELHTDLRNMMYIYKDYVSGVGNKDDWWPSQEEYPLNLTKEDWKKYILEVELPNYPAPMKMLKGMMLLGGEASCKQLSETYGGHPSVYAGCAMNLGRRVKKYFNLPSCMDGEQERYFPFPFIGKYRGGSEDNYLYRIRTELCEALEEIDLSSIDPTYERGERQLSTKDILQHINAYIAEKGFTFDEGLVENYYLSLKSKPFVILAGTSGTGKTRLVRLFAEAIGATSENGRYKLVSVRPDWSDSSDLFGHVDLNGNFVPGAIIDFINAAEWNSDNPYFLCLDEMNLARVEYYLSDILSIIETREYKEDRITTDLLVSENYYGADVEALKRYGEIRIPENLYIVGTVNMDETTFPFSRKVLDRANTIEFSTVDFLLGVEMPKFVEVRAMDLRNDFMKADYLFFQQCANEQKYVNELCVELQEINKILERANAHVGYRVRDEIVFYMLNNKKAGLLSEDEAFDNEIMQKILPRIQGSSTAVKNMLCELFKRCAGEYESYQTESDDISSKMFKAAQKAECKYRKSAEKIAFMVRRFEEDGFTAYWL